MDFIITTTTQLFLICKTLILPLFVFIALKQAIKGINNGLDEICKHKEIDYHTCHLIKKGLTYSTTIFALMFILQNLGIDITTLVAALGISGVALSFGLKDAIANIIAGILLILYKQFKINDYIKIKHWEGKVIDINIRYTTLQYENMTILIPNSVLYTSVVGIIKDK